VSQGELFGDPRPERVPRMRTPSKAARYARHYGAQRWCDQCIRDIQLKGFRYADPVRPARWVRVRSGEGTTYLCEIHKSERQGSER
jgi:hypothetical protein